MKKKNKKCLFGAVILLNLFIIWTILVKYIDVKTIGPNSKNVGFATINKLFYTLTGVHINLYIITDWLSIIPFLFIIGFAMVGIVQLIKRKSILRVDYNILVLGGFYIIVLFVYLFFEIIIINYRPILINGHLEASYPSSTTMLVMCIMPTAIMQLKLYIKNKFIWQFFAFIINIFIIFMVTLRLISGVHWLTDIIGGALFSIGIVLLHYCVCNFKIKNVTKRTHL